MFAVSRDSENVFFEIHLASLPFFSRLVNAVRYLFGRKAPWGDFEEIVVSKFDALVLAQELLDFAEGENHPFEPNDVY
jgi:hypothetical protein